MRALIVVLSLLLGTASLPSSVKATLEPMFDDPNCTGCQLEDDAEDSDSAECEGCTFTLYSEVYGIFTENCGSTNPCSAAECSFAWRVRYVTSGTCTGHTWEFDSGGPSTLTLPPNPNGRTLISKSPNYACGVSEPYSYSATFNHAQCTSVSVTISGNTGCSECTQVL